MLIMKIRIREVFIITLVLSFSVSGCDLTPDFWIPDETGGYEEYTDFDSRELAEQITDYWLYEEISEKKQEEIFQKVEVWKTEWITTGEYLVGEDIEAGIYIACPYGEEIYVAEEGDTEKWQRTWYMNWCYNSAFYLLLAEGDKVYLTGDSKIALADENSPSLAAVENNVYYEGTYLVGKDMPEGEYFVIDYDLGHVYKERDKVGFTDDTRFWYVLIEDCQFVNISGCVLFPVEDKPEIHPIKYQGTGEGEGQYVYPNGTYKIGIDIPLGTYKLKNELFPSGNNGIGDVGYHGNVDYYYPAGLNWCGLIGGSGAVDLNEPYRKKDIEILGWQSIELDNRIDKWLRSLKITTRASEGTETDYEMYWGLPTVTFTEEQIGCCIQVYNCILILQGEEER